MSSGHMITYGQPGEAVRSFREQLLLVGDSLPGGMDEPVAGEGGTPGSSGVPGDAEVGLEAAEQWLSGAGNTKGTARDDRPVRLTEVTVDYLDREHRPFLQPGEPLTVRIGFHASRPVKGVEFSIEFRGDRLGTLYRTDTGVLGTPVDVDAGDGTLEFAVESFPFLDGNYEVAVGIQSHLGGIAYDWRESAATFEVMNPGREMGIVGLQIKATVLPVESRAADAQEEEMWSRR